MKADVEEIQIARALGGNEQQQFEAICRAQERYSDPLASYILERVAPTIESHDLTMAIDDVFVELAKKAREGKFKEDGSLVSLLFRMARCNAIDAMRQSQKRYQRYIPLRFVSRDHRICWDGNEEDEIASRVSRKLANAPEIAATWRTLTQTRSAADETLANEVIRQFRLFIPTLSPLQRKVAEVMAFYFGDITDEEICDEIAKTSERPPVSSVKSARHQIRDKFKALLKSQERMVQS